MLYSTSIGLDVHARSISAAAFVFETGEVAQRTFGYDPDAVAAWAASLPQPAGCLYESGPTGFDLQRRLVALGLPRHVGAVSKMVRPSGDRVKTDRRDALFLSRLLAVGEFVECAPPTPAMEAARDLSRAREDAREALMRARHQLSKFLLRKGHVWPRGRSTWTRAHREWLRSIELDDPCERLVLEEYVAQVRECEERRDRLDSAIAERSGADDLAGVTSRLRALRGVSTVTAFGIAVEIGDFSRFASPRALMSYVGLVPSESSSGETTSRGGITKTGNSHVRRLLVEAAWHHARPLSPASETDVASSAGLPAEAAGIAARANRRLHRRYLDLRARGKGANVANVAVARELVGFCWALALCGRAAEPRNHPPARAARPRRVGHPAIRLCAARPGLATRDPRPAELPSRSVGMR